MIVGMVIPLSYTVHCQNHTGGEAAMWLLMSPPRKDVSYGAVWVVVWTRYLISLYAGLTIFNAFCVTALCTRLCTTNMSVLEAALLCPHQLRQTNID